MSAEFAYPLRDNEAMYDQAQVEEYLATLFRNVDWEPGQVISFLGIGEKGTGREGKLRDRQFVPPSFIGLVHKHGKRWASFHGATFVVPAVVKPEAIEAKDVTLDKVAALTAIILDLDSGDTDEKRAYVTAALGAPSMVVASGGKTDAGTDKLHLYWLFNEPSEEVERVAALRKQLAHKVGGDASFGRATQVIRVAGSVHAKNGKPSVCRIVDRSEMEYSVDDLAEIIEAMLPMPGVEMPTAEVVQLPLASGGVMDFTPKFDTAVVALHRDVNEGGEDLTRWGEFSKVAGFQIAEARAARITLDQAAANTYGWMIQHMKPAWPDARFQQEFSGVLKRDMETHGAWPQAAPLQAAIQQPAAQAEGIRPTPAAWPSPLAIPPRPWLFGRWLMRGKVTAVVAPGGVGKSSLMTGMVLSLASSREVLGKTVYGGPLRPWLWNLEDGGDDLARQRVAAAIHYGIGPEMVGDRLFVDSGPEGARLCLAVEDRNGFTIIQPVVENVIEAIRANSIDCLIIDPFVSSHQVNENDNNKIDAVAKTWSYIAQATGCSIVLVHHSTKLHGEKVTADSARGAGALNNAARITLVLNRMSGEEAELWGIDPSKMRRYFSVGDDKHNLSPAERADWFELQSVSLNNGNDTYEADSIGVVVPWRPPSLMDGVDVEHLFYIQKALNAGTYFRHPGKHDLWAGDVVSNVIGIDATEAAGKKRITSLLTMWMSKGALKVGMARNHDRKNKETVEVGNWVCDPGTPPPPPLSLLASDDAQQPGVE